MILQLSSNCRYPSSFFWVMILENMGYNVTLTVVNGTGGMNTHSELVDVHIKGDVNRDGKLSAANAVLILQMAVCGINIDPAADVNSDGAITSLDALMVSQAVMKGVSDE